MRFIVRRDIYLQKLLIFKYFLLKEQLAFENILKLAYTKLLRQIVSDSLNEMYFNILILCIFQLI